jgi:phage-related minor tail protein
MSHKEKEDMCENNESEPETMSEESSANDEMPQQTAREIQIHYENSPAPQRNREIHSRQIIPPVPEANEEVSDYTPSPPVDID